LQVALHQRDAGLAVLEHHFHRLVVHRVAFAIAAAARHRRPPLALAIEHAAFEHALDVVGLALALQVVDHAVHLVVADEGAVHADRQAGAGGMYSMSPMPSSASAPIWSRMVRLSILLLTWKACASGCWP
jgi:hypothetical protein